MDVVIVESPAKAKTINKYLGSNYKVFASYGHVRDLPSKDGSVLPDEDFSMIWAVDSKAKSRLSEITKAVKASDKLILATDPDREGEAISWHVLQVLRDKKAIGDKPVERVVFNAITKKSILDAMENPREIDVPLVDAYLARRALDYLVGFTLSPVLWRKLPGARSAGRVQSVALRLICQRENEIERFKPQEYWTIVAGLSNTAKTEFEVRLTVFEGEKLGRLDVKTEEQAKTIRSMLMGADFKVAVVEAKPTKRNPYAPFTTSTLQQEASSKLGYSASRTMQIAQRLYEGADIGGETVGLITYMRTDGVQIAPEAIEQTRNLINSEFGAIYLPDKARHYTAKAKNAQEAHEAIRPTDLSRLPKDMTKYLNQEQAKLYELIWKRTVASQMASAKIERTTVDVEATNSGKVAMLRANGSVIKFDGFLKLYQAPKTDGDKEDDKRLPPIAENEALERQSVDATQHHTEPPARYSEASLIKKMEELGIGRPSTYASTLGTLEARDYVTIDKRRLIPQAKGRLVTSFLESFFERYVEYDFTAELEKKLDQISAGELAWKDVLREFWTQFSAAVDETKDLRVTEVLDTLNEALGPLAFPEKEDGTDPRICPTCGGGQLSLKVGKFGAFIGCSNYPECKFTRQLGVDGLQESQAADEGPKVLGRDPETDEEISLRTGRFGPYVQRGEGKEIKRASLPKGWAPDTIDYEKALQLLALPRVVGLHPESGKEIKAGIGRYGPFVLHEGMYANLEAVEDVFTIGLNHAVTVIAEKIATGGARRGGATSLKDLGEHPELGGPIAVMDGRYGPYVKHGKVNATLPKDKDPQEVTIAEAVELIAARAAKGGKKPRKKAAPKKKPAAKKATAKKPAAKKKAPTKKPAAKKKTPAKSAD